ncbi:EF-Tu C-terminal domain-related protein [Lignipirellula cremea]|uniref:Elongation factor Tu n=1 Tax=Lignipirellula cremea TaxID=2528010 RepID=A0A518DP54_9BACT|nr:hypothetical protein [Lignipirellula cremea]QDU93627.1 Elongation factor Tu [Lignipirellula cremea]
MTGENPASQPNDGPPTQERVAARKSAFTIPADEAAAGRVALYLDPDDLRWLAARCFCDDTTSEKDRERCARIRFRSAAAIHKAGQTIAAPADVDFVASVRLLTTAMGGRRSRIQSGYRPQVFLDGEDCDAFLTLEDETLHPGDVGMVRAVLRNPSRNRDKLAVGKALLLREGDKTIAYGVIVWIAAQTSAGE